MTLSWRARGDHVWGYAGTILSLKKQTYLELLHRRLVALHLIVRGGQRALVLLAREPCRRGRGPRARARVFLLRRGMVFLHLLSHLPREAGSPSSHL